MTLLKLALQESFVFFIKNNFWSAPHFSAYTTLQQSLAGMLTFWGINLNFTYRYFCNFKICSHVAWIPQIL
jgi:hypothetical protein